MKEVEYKDTFSFKLFPKYDYSILQKRRCTFFQGRIEHYRKIINYADKFDTPNKINIVYMIGYSDQLSKYVLKTKSNLVVLCAEVPMYVLKIYDEYWEMVERLNKAGLVNQDGSFNDMYTEHRDGFYRYYGEDNLENETIRSLKAEQQIAEKYESIIPIISKCFCEYKIIDKVHAIRRVSHNDLDKIIKRYFPLGREQCGLTDSACKSIAKIKQAAECGLKHDDECVEKLLGTSSAEKKEILRRNIKRLDMNLNTSLRENGFVNLKMAYDEMKKPPYGWDSEPCASYCFAYVVASHMQNHWIYDGVNVANVDEYGTSLVEAIIKGFKSRNEFILFNVNGERLSKRFSLMFDIEPKVPFAAMILPLCKSIEKHTRIPVSVLDDKFVTIFRECDYLYNSCKMREIIKYFSWDRCREIRDKYATINDDVLNRICEKYKCDTKLILDVCTTVCSGWLWDGKMFYETVQKYMINGKFS